MVRNPLTDSAILELSTRAANSRLDDFRDLEWSLGRVGFGKRRHFRKV